MTIQFRIVTLKVRLKNSSKLFILFKFSASLYKAISETDAPRFYSSPEGIYKLRKAKDSNVVDLLSL